MSAENSWVSLNVSNGWFSAGPLLGARAAKADIRLGADLAPGGMDPAWMLRSLVDRSPLVWMAEVNGLLVDLRDKGGCEVQRHTSRPAGQVKKNGRPRQVRLGDKARQECLGIRRPIAKICFGSSSKGACLEVAGRIHPSALYLSTVVAIGHLTLRFASATMSEFHPTQSFIGDPTNRCSRPIVGPRLPYGQ